MENNIYNQKGETIGKINLPENVFGLPWNGDLVHQVITSMRSNARTNTAHSKGRGEVRGGGRKPWRQKGTGRARHGSIRSPIWRGGGVTHGPSNERNYQKKINQKMKRKAFFTVLSAKRRDGELLLLNKISFAKTKTKEAAKAIFAIAKTAGLPKLSYKKGNRALISLPKASKDIQLSFRNIPSVEVERLSDLSPLDIINYQYLIIAEPEESIKMLEEKMSK